MRRTAADAARTRTELLDAALVVFAEKGWSGATFDGIARAAGVTRGAVHHHFPDKDTLLREVLRAQWERRGGVVLGPLHDPGSPPGPRLVAFVENYLDLLHSDPGLRALAVVSTLVAPRTDPTAADLADKQASTDAWGSEIRAVLVEAGPLRPGLDADLGVFVLMNFLMGAVVAVAAHPVA
ncbi:MAG: TetR/AcrR family transcriptional regulator, partial [Pseudonocardia sp.]